MEVVRHLSEGQWRDFVDSHPQAQVFHTPEMFQVFARAKGHRPALWAAVDGGQVQALFLPVYVTLFDGPLRRITTRAIVYGSVLYAPGPEGLKALSLVLHTYRRQANGISLFTELRNLSDLSPAQPVLKECGFVYEDHLNYLIDLRRPAEEILQSFGPRTRKHVRRALRRDEVSIEEIREPEQMAAVFDLLTQTYRRAKVPLADRSLFDAAFDVLYPRGMIKVSLARVAQSPAAASVELLYRDVIYGWYGGSAREFGAHQPNELLTWHVLQWGASQGFGTYDFGGAGKPDEEYGVRDFKAKFGGDMVSFGRNTCVHAPHLLRLSEWGYMAYQHVLSRLGLSPSVRRGQTVASQGASGID